MTFPKPSVGANCPLLPPCVPLKSSPTRARGRSWRQPVDTGHHHRMDMAADTQKQDTGRTNTHPAYSMWVCTYHTRARLHTSLILFSTWTLNCLAAIAIYHGLMWLTSVRNKSTHTAWMCVGLDSTKLYCVGTIHQHSWRFRPIFYPMIQSEMHINISR